MKNRYQKYDTRRETHKKISLSKTAEYGDLYNKNHDLSIHSLAKSNVEVKRNSSNYTPVVNNKSISTLENYKKVNRSTDFSKITGNFYYFHVLC